MVWAQRHLKGLTGLALLLTLIAAVVLTFSMGALAAEKQAGGDGGNQVQAGGAEESASGEWTFERGITIVCPWGVDGGADSTIRPMCKLLEEYLGVPVEVRNETGESGVVGATYAYQQDADGYTFLLGTQSLYLQDLIGEDGL